MNHPRSSRRPRHHAPTVGRNEALARIFPGGKALVAPVDDVSLSGPEGGLRRLERTLPKIIRGRPDGILVMLGTLEVPILAPLLRDQNVIVNVTTSSIRHDHTHKVVIGTPEGAVDRAIHAGAAMISTHVNVGSQWESEMLENMTRVGEVCRRRGIGYFVHVYPRSENPDGSDNNYLDEKRQNPLAYAERVRHCVAIAIHTGGADAVKTQYTGRPDTFASVVESACGIPILIAGGPQITARQLLANAYGAVLVGGAGLAGGRNIFNSPQVTAIVQAARSVIHEGASPEPAIETFGIRDVNSYIPTDPAAGHFLG